MHISNVFRIFVLMNEQVTDISQVLKRQTSEKASMREGMDAKHTENRTLRKRLEKYDRLKKNSNNSTTPPSKSQMKEALRNIKSLRRKSGLKPIASIYR